MSQISTKFKHLDLPLDISVHENKLLMFHTPFMSQQFPLNSVGVEVTLYPEGTKLGIWHHDGETYQSLYIIKEDYQAVREFFKQLGFPVPEISVPSTYSPNLKIVPK